MLEKTGCRFKFRQKTNNETLSASGCGNHKQTLIVSTHILECVSNGITIKFHVCSLSCALRIIRKRGNI